MDLGFWNSCRISYLCFLITNQLFVIMNNNKFYFIIIIKKKKIRIDINRVLLYGGDSQRVRSLDILIIL